MRMNYLLAFAVSTFLAFNVEAQSLLPSVSRDIGATAATNIEQAERLFCYHISNKPQNYKGYTIDNMAITGFCGILDTNLKDMLTEQLLATDGNIDFDSVANCTIEPRILLRFVRGVDNTDVLISTPCPAISVFYSGKVTTYNMQPAQELLDTIANAFSNTRTAFVSPALLNQLLPVGVVQTAEQRATLNRPAQPKRNWDESSSSEAPKDAGWNSLNFI